MVPAAVPRAAAHPSRVSQRAQGAGGGEGEDRHLRRGGWEGFEQAEQVKKTPEEEAI